MDLEAGTTQKLSQTSRSASRPRAMRIVLCVLVSIGAIAPAAHGLGFAFQHGASRVPLAQSSPQLTVVDSGISPLAASAIGEFGASARPMSRTSSTWSAAAGAASTLAAALLWAARRRSPAVAMGAWGRIPVRQWAPEKIPPSVRRAPEDRIRIKIFAHHPASCMEAVETLEDFAKECGGETEGPMVQPRKRLHMYLNKSPKGHKKSKYHKFITEHCWILDFYPPAGGGLDAIMKIRLPHTVSIKIE